MLQCLELLKAPQWGSAKGGDQLPCVEAELLWELVRLGCLE